MASRKEEAADKLRTASEEHGDASPEAQAALRQFTAAAAEEDDD